MKVHTEVDVTDQVVALLEEERARYWHTKPRRDDPTDRVVDERATMACMNCAVAHRVLDDLLAKVRPLSVVQPAATPARRPCCDVCTP